VSGIKSPQLFKTNNGGKNWLSTNFLYGDIIKFFNENLGLVVYLAQALPNIKFKISRTTDGGNTWEMFDIDSKGWPNDFEFLPDDPSKVWYIDLENLYFSSDTGRNWTEQKIFDGELKGRDIVFTDNEHGWLLCDGKLFHTSNNGGIISSVTANKNQIPLGYSLEQNYPNPFNPVTTIKYSIPEYSFVNLTVYDLLGREVQTLINEYKPAGKYQTIFNADKLSSGVYVLTLKAGEFKGSKKIILLK